MSQQDSSPRKRFGLTAILGLAIAIFLVAGALMFASAPDPEALPAALPQAPELRTHTLRAEPLVHRTEIAGLLEPRRRVDIFAEVDGRVLEVGARELDRVEAEQLLVRMDPTLAQVEIDRANAAAVRARAEGKLAEANLDRNKGLANVNVASRAALDEAESASGLARAAGLEARAALAEAEDRLAKKTVRAPFAGVLRHFPVEVGEYVQPGERVGEILDVDRLRVTIGLTDQQIVTVEPGSRALISIDARPGQSFEAEVVRVGSAIDLNTRKFPVRIEVDNEAGALMPGMVARVSLTLVANRPAMTVPRDAVVDEFGLKHVFVVEADAEGGHHVLRRRVEVASIPFEPTRLEVRAGVAEGEQIAISSVRQLRDGMAVRPVAPITRPPLTANREIR